MPLVNYLYNTLYMKVQLYKTLRPVLKHGIRIFDVSKAYDRALQVNDSCSLRLKEIYKRETAGADDIHVVFLGRPYAVLPGP